MSDTLFPLHPISASEINGVFYQYTAVKEAGDPYTVSVQNQAADGSGYIFRSTDDWSGGSGGTIQKFVPVPYSPVGDWGDGSIEQVGIGSVEDATVLYSYRFDPDRVQPQIDIELPDVPIYDALADGYVTATLEPTDLNLIQDDEELEKGKDEEEDDKRLETALAASDNALTMGMDQSQAQILAAMNTATNLTSYYAAKLQGGELRETVVLIDKNLPDNRRALRSLGQDRLHTQMVDQQYGR